MSEETRRPRKKPAGVAGARKTRRATAEEAAALDVAASALHGETGAGEPPPGEPRPGQERGSVPPPGPAQVPILAVRNTVVFPNTVVPLTIGRPKSLAAVGEAMKGNRVLGIVTERPEHSASTDEVTGEGLFAVGTWAVIHKMIKVPGGDVKILVQGLARVRVEEVMQAEPFLLAKVDVLDEAGRERTPQVEALMRQCVEQAEKVITLSPYLPEELRQAVNHIDDPVHLAYLVGSVMKMEVAEKQAVLEAEDASGKLEKVTAAVVRELQVLQVSGKIQSQVASELEKKQKEFFLREQMRAIKEELGEGEEDGDVKQLRDQVEQAKLPEHVMKEALRELGRMEKMHASSPEFHVIRTYLDWILNIPWTTLTEDNLDLGNARRVLDEDHYDLEKIKDRLVEYLAVRKLRAELKGPILCFVGPPGVGKTSLGKSIARALGRKFQRMSLGGIHDEAEIRGHRRTYVGAMPGRIVQAMKRAGSANPVIMLDEIDKVGRDFRGDPSSALLEVLDPEQNHAFRDHYLDLDLDLSRALFIATANVLDPIQPALRDRMEILRLPGYTTEDKLHIATTFLLPKQKKEHGIEQRVLEIGHETLKAMISGWTSEAGVRNLERQIATLCRKVATRVAKEIDVPAAIRPEDLVEYMGPQKVFPEAAMRTSVPGVATGLAWTEDGGQILFVEALRMPGKGNLTLTGHMGDVMQESARTALSYVRSAHAALGLDEKFFEGTDIHVHVPAGAIPKDGPSAGVAMATAIASVFTNRCVSHLVAMTGEITLTGLVLPVGGIREKVLAARRAGIHRLVLPRRNEADVEEIPAEYREGLEVHFAERIGDVWAVAFLPREECEPVAATASEAAAASAAGR
jgi:ATP-dependent Lon protease